MSIFKLNIIFNEQGMLGTPFKFSPSRSSVFVIFFLGHPFHVSATKIHVSRKINQEIQGSRAIPCNPSLINFTGNPASARIMRLINRKQKKKSMCQPQKSRSIILAQCFILATSRCSSFMQYFTYLQLSQHQIFILDRNSSY